MNCTKCGRETADNAAFCKKCLGVMAQYPVKPGTVIQLPQRKKPSLKKASPRKKVLSAEETIAAQRKTIKWLWILLICTFLMLILSAALLYHLSQKPEITNNTTIGQNYMTRDTSEK